MMWLTIKSNQRMLTWIVVNDHLKNWTASTENNLVGFELSLILTHKSEISQSFLLIKISEHQPQMVWECIPGQSILLHHLLFVTELNWVRGSIHILQNCKTKRKKSWKVQSSILTVFLFLIQLSIVNRF